MKRILCLRIEPAGQPIDALKTVAARCKPFTPLVGIDPDVFPQSVLLDITNVVHLFGGEAALVRKILDELRAEGWPLRAAAAATPGAAWALAGYGRKAEGDDPPAIPSQATGRNEIAVSSPMPDNQQRITNGLLPPSLSALPLEALRLPEPIVALLHGLGVWRIEELEALPRRELSSRFGPELLDCLDRVTGRLSEPLPAWDPPPQFEVHWSAAEINEYWPIARRELIEAALEQLVRRLAAMLARAGRGAMRLECLLKCAAEDGEKGVGNRSPERPEGCCAQTVPDTFFSVGLFRPTAWANHLVQLLQVRFESLRLPGPVDSIRLVAASTAPLELRQQELFFERQTRIEPHHLSGLIDRLSNRLGHTSVMRVRLIPDAQPELACHYAPLVLGREVKGGIKVSATVCAKHPKSRSGKRWPTPLCQSQAISPPPSIQPRPLRLLTRPVRLPGGMDGSFSFAGRQHRIVRRLGPERIETGWWRGRTVARDYYRIETTTGRRYWVFRRLPAGPWFLHGMFD